MLYLYSNRVGMYVEVYVATSLSIDILLSYVVIIDGSSAYQKGGE